MSVRVDIRGIGNVERNANKFEKNIIKAVHGAMIKSAYVDIETGAKKKITQDGHIDTGRLRASIHTTYKSKEIHNYNDMQGKSFEAMLDVVRKEFNIFVGSDVIYATKIEMLDSFIYFAFKQAQQKLPSRIKKEVKRVLNGMR